MQDRSDQGRERGNHKEGPDHRPPESDVGVSRGPAREPGAERAGGEDEDDESREESQCSIHQWPKLFGSALP